MTIQDLVAELESARHALTRKTCREQQLARRRDELIHELKEIDEAYRTSVSDIRADQHLTQVRRSLAQAIADAIAD